MDASNKVDFTIDIQGDVGANIETNTTTGVVSKHVSAGFSAPEDQPVSSSSYPAGGNFDVTLRTTTGGIGIDAKYVDSYTHSPTEYLNLMRSL